MADQITVHAAHPVHPEGEQRLLYGVIAEFEHAHEVVEAAHKARSAGYTKMDAYSPLPVEGLAEALGYRDHSVAWIMFWGGIIGAFTGFGLLTFTTVFDYPLNIGGRPLFAWPSFIPITFEMTVLVAALSGILGMIILNDLPKPYHPVFDAPNFDRASSDRFFLCVEASDPRFNAAETRRFMESLGAYQVSEVELRK